MFPALITSASAHSEKVSTESGVLAPQLLETFRRVSELLPFAVSPFKLFEFCHTYVTQQCEL